MTEHRTTLFVRAKIGLDQNYLQLDTCSGTRPRENPKERNLLRVILSEDCPTTLLLCPTIYRLIQQKSIEVWTLAPGQNGTNLPLLVCCRFRIDAVFPRILAPSI
jgi:hypothetical protein